MAVIACVSDFESIENFAKKFLGQVSPDHMKLVKYCSDMMRSDLTLLLPAILRPKLVLYLV